MIPSTFRIHAAQPNPFAVTTTIRYDLPQGRPVTVRIYDVMGRLVREIDNSQRGPGIHAATWDGRDDAGRPVASGVYLSHVRAGSEEQTRRLVLLR